jgi:hypothetical protein
MYKKTAFLNNYKITLLLRRYFSTAKVVYNSAHKRCFSFNNIRFVAKIIALLLLSLRIKAQTDSTKGHFSGSLQADFQRYAEDNFSPKPDEKIGLNTYLTLFYQRKNLLIGGRYEGYFPPLIGYSENLRGNGLVNRFIDYKIKHFSFTLGNFYEQFGNGMVLRSYESRSLGIDNSLDGFRVKFDNKFLKTKAFIGKQRIGFNHSVGTLIGVDNELIINELWKNKKGFMLSIGGSFISKNEPYDGILKTLNTVVNMYSGRVNFQQNSFNFSAELAGKSADVSPANKYITHQGLGLLITSNVDIKNSSFSLIIKRLDNMDFRSQRTETINNGLINFIPAITKQQTYRLLGLYPYATQVLGEISGQIDAVHRFENGATLTANVAMVNGLNKTPTNTDEGYTANFFEIGNEKYYRNFSVEYERKWSKKFKTNILFALIDFNKSVILGEKPEIVRSYTFVIDGTYKFQHRKALRFELQHLSTKQDVGNWAMMLTELSISPHYFFYVSDEVNYGDFDFQNVRHYYNVGAAINFLNARLSVSYGRQRAGLLCVGGVCRLVPAYSGLSLNLTKTF